MIDLVRPDVGLHQTWAQAMSEHHLEGLHVSGAGWWMLPDAEQWDLTESGCRRLVKVLLAAAEEPAHLSGDAKSGQVSCDFYWMVEGSPSSSQPTVVGFLALRHRLNALLLQEGGHIGYSVRPSRRRQGLATRALALGVGAAARRGIERVLVTCDDDNLASARTIEGGGGVYEDTRNGRRRYWIETGPRT